MREAGGKNPLFSIHFTFPSFSRRCVEEERRWLELFRATSDEEVEYDFLLTSFLLLTSCTRQV